MWKKLTVKYQTETIIDYDDFKKVKRLPQPRKKQHSKKVISYSLDGEKLATYNTVGEAATAEGLTWNIVYSCCIGKNLISSRACKIYLFEGVDINERLKEIENNKKIKL